MRRVVVCWLASLGHAVVAMVVQAAIRRLPSALPPRFADCADACALNRAILVDGAASAIMRPNVNTTEAATAHPAHYFMTHLNAEEFALWGSISAAAT
jgi:hypothetical protein